MSKLTFKGDIVYGEKYQDRQTGEDKWKNAKVGALFIDEKGNYRIKFLGSWLSVYAPRINETHFEAAKEAVRGQDDFTDEIPF